MKRILLLVLVALVLTGCGEKKAEVLASCYHGAVGDSNSVFTVDSQSNGVLEGKMAFVFAQKDSSHGTYKGLLKDGKLTATYTFWSEGVQSVGTLVFDQSGRDFVGQGYTYKPAANCANYLPK